MSKKLFCLILGLFFCGCGALFQNMPPPQAGLTTFINPNMGAVARCWLYNGYWPKGSIFAVDQYGKPSFAMPAMMRFKIASSCSAEFKKAPWTILPASTNYTLFIVWTRFYGQVLGMSVVHFDTSNDPFRSPYIDSLGRKIYVDTVVELPRVNTNTVTNLTFNAEWPITYWLSALIGLQ